MPGEDSQDLAGNSAFQGFSWQDVAQGESEQIAETPICQFAIAISQSAIPNTIANCNLPIANGIY